VLAIDLTGNYWSYSKSNDKWNDITQILQREKQVTTSENQNQLSIRNVDCSDNIHIAVTNNGILFNYINI